MWSPSSKNFEKILTARYQLEQSMLDSEHTLAHVLQNQPLKPHFMNKGENSSCLGYPPSAWVRLLAPSSDTPGGNKEIQLVGMNWFPTENFCALQMGWVNIPWIKIICGLCHRFTTIQAVQDEKLEKRDHPDLPSSKNFLKRSFSPQVQPLWTTQMLPHGSKRTFTFLGTAHGTGMGAGGTSPTSKELTLQQHPAALCIHCFLPKHNQLLTPYPQTSQIAGALLLFFKWRWESNRKKKRKKRKKPRKKKNRRKIKQSTLK